MAIRSVLVVGCALLIPVMTVGSLSFFVYGTRQGDRLGGVRAAMASLALTLVVGYVLVWLLGDLPLLWVITGLLVLLLLLGTWWERRIRRQG